MGGKIDGYLDCTSPYSYFAITYLRKRRPLLEQYGVEVEFHPIFLGGINVTSGNTPPWTVPAKAKYGPYDLKRAIKFFETPKLSSPPFFPILSVLPQRCMLYIKRHYPREVFETTFLSLWTYSFLDHVDISQPPNLIRLLSDKSQGNNYSESEIKDIMNAAKTKEYKDLLTNETKKCVEQYGAFGAPWFWLTNDKGEQEPLFGSDRWAYMWDFLGVPYKNVEIIDQRSASGGAGTGAKSKL